MTNTDQLRIWIYQSNRDFTSSEAEQILSHGKIFIDSWSSHGAKMTADFEIKYNRFMIISANEKEAQASGCSIDKSVHFIKELEKLFSVILLDRSKIAYRKGNDIETFKFNELDAMLASGEVTMETPVFNNLVTKESDLQTKWEIPLKNSPFVKSFS